MLHITKKAENGVLRVELKGIIDEAADLEGSLGTEFKEIHVSSMSVNRINSVGIKTWRSYFHKLRDKGILIKFFELSPDLLSQASFISDFIGPNEIQSICAPFLCQACSTGHLKTYTLDEVRKLGFDLKPVPCPKCNAPSEFDEIASDFFAFMNP